MSTFLDIIAVGNELRPRYYRSGYIGLSSCALFMDYNRNTNFERSQDYRGRGTVPGYGLKCKAL